MIAALVYLWFFGFVLALFAQATSRRDIPRPDRAPALVAVILAYVWPLTLLVIAIENRWAIAAWWAATAATAADRLVRRRKGAA